MAEKTLNTRILLKYDTLARWSNSTLVLKKGEIAIATIPTADPANKHLPPVMFKVGDGTKTFAQLDWASGLAADVYTWAKAAVRPTYKYGDTDLTGFGTAAAKNVGDFETAGAAAAAESNAKAYVDQQIAAIPSQAEYTLETGEDDGTLVLKKDGVTVGDAAVVKGWAELLTTVAGKYVKPTGGIPKADLASAVQTSLGKADTALQSHQTVQLETGTNNGTLKLTVGSDVTDNIAVKGLGSAAYTASTDYDTAGKAKELVDAHNVSADAHTDIRESVTALAEKVSGRATGYVFANKQDPKYISAIGKAGSFVIGDTIYFTDANVPDEWVTAVNSTSPFYTFQNIETEKPDLNGYVPTSRKINNKSLTTDINLGAADVGVNETAFPGLNKVGTITGIKMNGVSKGTSGIVDLGTVITDISGKQDSLNAEQLLAVNSGITAEKVGIYDGYADGKQDTITSTNKLSADLVSGLGAAAKKGVDTTIAANSTSANLPTSAAVENRINAHVGIDKVGTVTSVSTTADGGLKVTNGTTAAVIDIDDAVTFILDCGNSTL